MPSNFARVFAKKNVFATVTVASVLLLSTGCAPEVGIFGGGGSGGTGTSTSESGGAGTTGTDGDNDADSDTQGGKEADGGTNAGDKSNDDASQGAVTGAKCFPGNWIVNIEDIENYMESLAGGATIKSSGNILLTYNEDGTSQTHYDNWTNTITVADGSSVVVRDGIDKGTYSVTENGTFSGSDTSIGSVTKMTATGPNGQVIAMTVDPEPSVFNKGKYTCEGDLLTMQIDGYTLTSYREH